MQTDADLGSSFVIYEREPITGYIVKGSYNSPSIPTTAGKFCLGCRVLDRSTGVNYVNCGTVAAPAWESDELAITVSMTAAEIISNYTTSKLIIPGVPGKVIILDSFEYDLTGTATQFTGGGVVNLQYDSTANGAGTTLHADIAAAVITGATARTITKRIPKDLSSLALATAVGTGVYLGTKTAVFATGTGTAVLRVRYHLI